uniref:Uncharacterized protein n=1 Tax=Timema cristinae TaxID=61476 RepID=A0A7R9GUB3_TIMCR|nr:unnamed protein product [Timema cristinae]
MESPEESYIRSRHNGRHYIGEVVELLKANILTLNKILTGMSKDEEAHIGELAAVQDTVKLIFMQVDNLSQKYHKVCLKDLEIDSKLKQIDLKVSQKVKAQFLTRHVRDNLIGQLQDENKELRRRLAVFQDGDRSVIDLEKAERDHVMLIVQKVEEEILALREYTNLVKREIAKTEKGWKSFCTKTVNGMKLIEDNVEEIEEKAKHKVVVGNYEVFLKECQRIFDDSIRGIQGIPLVGIRRSNVVQKAIRDGMNMATFSQLAHIYAVISEDEPYEIHGLDDVLAYIADLESKIFLKHEEYKMQLDAMLMAIIDMKKQVAVMKEALESSQKQCKQLQEIIENQPVPGLQGDLVTRALVEQGKKRELYESKTNRLTELEEHAGGEILT